MIQPRAGVAFSLAAEGDLRNDQLARHQLAAALGISPQWASLRQVHGNRVVEAGGPGDLGEADALFTRRPMLPIAIFTADCAGVVLGSSEAVGVAHAGWRGAAAGVVSVLAEAMTAAGVSPRWAMIGPVIGSCCFEVGSEVAELFEAHVSTTSWGTVSVDLAGSLREQVQDLDVWEAGVCTFHDHAYFSHRRDGIKARMAALAWLPS